MASNFAFLHEKFPEFEKLAELAESYCRSDSHSCLLKIGLLCEGMVKVMFAMDKITLPERTDAAERIDILSRRGLLPQNVSAAFHLVRKVRNKAAHEGLSLPENQTLYYLQIVHSLCDWFYQTYGDERYQHAAFVAPAAPSAATPAPTTEAADEKLMARAESRAAEAPAAPEAQRRERAERASSRRYISEAETRLLIDEQLRKVGWEADTENLRHPKGTRPAPGRNLAIAEWPTDSPTGSHGFADYALFIGMKLVAVIEAKAAHKAIPSVLDQQCKEYASHIRAEDQPHIIGEWRGYRVPFIFAANGRPYIKQWEEQSGIWFQDLREASNAPQALHGWMSPTGMEELLARDIASGNRRLSELPRDFLTDKDGLNLREYQLRAINAAEEAIVAGRDRILLAMATGTGKTRTVLGMMYRFLKSGRFKRILFLVDRTALGNQALDTFSDVKLEELMPLTDIYSVKSLEDKGIDKETRVHVATVQGMVKRILYSEDGEPRPAVSDYDLIIVDEAHRGYILDKEMTDEEQLYRDQRDYQSKYREVIEYFSAVKIALTATPALQTTEIFGPPVFTYMYREAVIDGYLVDHDAPHQLHTQLSDSGIHYKSGDKVITFDPITGEINNAELLDDELDFEVEHFNRSVINENFNRAILEEIARDIDPEDASSGKTLIYAVDDKHADMIVQIVKEISSRYCVDENAIMKITGSIGDRKRIDQAIRRFKNEAFPSIAVTVDLLTTGIDVPEITRLVFMRRVKSRILFEQMLGRATRLCPDIRKTHFEVYDAVGIYATLS
ncbi:type I restriction-modification system endonuclease, partial [Mailhella sp.]